MYVSEFVNDKATASSDAKADILESLEERITGRYLAEDNQLILSTGEVIFSCKPPCNTKESSKDCCTSGVAKG